MSTDHAPFCQCGACQQARLTAGTQPLHDPQPQDEPPRRTSRKTVRKRGK